MGAARLTPGQRFGDYVVEARVGEGGMGAVYRAIDSRLGRPVALKVMQTGDDGSPEAIARFVREARVGASLAHPGIAVVYEAGAVGACPFLAMEWVDGVSLAVAMMRGELAPAHRLEILASVVDALAYAHARGVIHRDVKPTNVMLDTRGRARLVDFGIARQTAAFGPVTMMMPTHARALLGTPAYMAPEQMISPSVDGRADQFAWGVLAYELLSGTHPGTTVATGAQPFPITKAAPLTWQRPEVGEAVAAVVHRAIGYEPGARFGSMDELAAALRAARADASAGGPTPGWTPPVVLPAVPLGEQPTVYGSHASVAPYGVPGAVPGPLTPMNSAYTPSPPRASGPAGAAGAAGAARAGGFRWPLAIAGGVAVLALGAVGVLVALLMFGRIEAPATPLSGPKRAKLEPLKLAQFGTTQAALTSAETALDQRLTACIDGTVDSGMMFSVRLFVADDGTITRVDDFSVCRNQHSNYYVCTERAEIATPKRGHPTTSEPVFACLERTFVGTKLPPVKRGKNEDIATVDVDVNIN